MTTRSILTIGLVGFVILVAGCAHVEPEEPALDVTRPVPGDISDLAPPKWVVGDQWNFTSGEGFRYERVVAHSAGRYRVEVEYGSHAPGVSGTLVDVYHYNDTNFGMEKVQFFGRTIEVECDRGLFPLINGTAHCDQSYGQQWSYEWNFLGWEDIGDGRVGIHIQQKLGDGHVNWEGWYHPAARYWIKYSQEGMTWVMDA